MIRYFLAFFITIMLGPGTGHLILRRYKKAAVLIGIVLFTVLLTSAIMLFSIDFASLPKDYAAINEYAKNFLLENFKTMFIIDIPIAAAWAYALLDIAAGIFAEYKKARENNDA